MEFTGTHRIDAAPQAVWAAITDPDMLLRCVPGAETVERDGEACYALVMAAAVGPLRARFRGRLLLQDVQAACECTMVFEGDAGVAGFGRGRASVRLSPQDQGTELAYRAQAEVGGKLAQVGSRLIDSVARKMSEDFFGALQRELAAMPPGADTARISHVGDQQRAAPPAVDAADDASAAARRHGCEAPAAARARRRDARAVAVGWLIPVLGAGVLLGWLGATYLR